jgi:hypothetical protein
MMRNLAVHAQDSVMPEVGSKYPDLTETFAIRCALGNNGGTWGQHYTDEQKEYWRRFVRDLIVHIKIGLANEDPGPCRKRYPAGG